MPFVPSSFWVKGLVRILKSLCPQNAKGSPAMLAFAPGQAGLAWLRRHMALSLRGRTVLGSFFHFFPAEKALEVVLKSAFVGRSL